MADNDDRGISGWGIFFLILFIVVIFASVGWIFHNNNNNHNHHRPALFFSAAYVSSHSFTQYRARRLGLPAPSLNPFVSRDRNRNAYAAPAAEPSGIKSFFSKTVSSIKNIGSGGGRSTTGGYESTGRDRRGFGPLDPDEAWDSRVGNEYYEEQELGLQDPQQGPYGGNGYGNVVGAEVDGGRGRSKSRQRELDERYDEEMGLGAPANKNPFGDDAAMRGVSPRPMIDTRKSHLSQKSLDVDNSPSERRSMFRENM